MVWKLHALGHTEHYHHEKHRGAVSDASVAADGGLELPPP